MTVTDWNPELYDRFSDLRLRPALDLLARVGALPDGPVCDLGCGSGSVGPVLAARFPDRAMTGVDRSPAMLGKAGATGAYADLVQADIAGWGQGGQYALVFSNAALHWLDDHATLLPRLVGALRPGGTLAVQVPHQNRAPSHRIWLDLLEEHFPGRLDPDTIPGVCDPSEYFGILSTRGRFDLWETEYFQRLPASDVAHPVRLFTSSTFARPVLECLRKAEADKLCALYDAVMDHAYPRQSDGTVIFPFRRMFFMLEQH